MPAALDPESIRLIEDDRRERNWKRFGPYLAERQWGTVREDYSEYGTCWDYFPHDHARSRVYRWGEDGLLGFCDRQARLCFSLALWNERDAILKERLFGLGGPEGNHGEDVKELYYYLDSSPTHSYCRALYKYPQAAFPYAELVAENRRRSKREREYELVDTGVFADDRYFDVVAEYAKASPDDLVITLHLTNRGPEMAPLHLLPTLWFRNTWSWGRTTEGYTGEPTIRTLRAGVLEATHESLGTYLLAHEIEAPFLFTDNETNSARVFGAPGATYNKDAFHRFVIEREHGAIRPEPRGTKAAAHYRFELAPGETRVVCLRLVHAGEDRADLFGDAAAVVAARRDDTDRYYTRRIGTLPAAQQQLARDAYAGLLWSKQFYYYDVKAWLEGDPSQPPPPPGRARVRNYDWRSHLYNRDVISMPDKWEYPWYASWDLAFHMLPFGRIDESFARDQLLLFLREWYQHGNGQLPAYEFNFSDVNPPVHAWAALALHRMSDARDPSFLQKVFHKLLLNFTWWVNRKDAEGNNLFAGGFLGLDNIGVFDRSRDLPTGGQLEQADGTAWMAFYCAQMLAIALELARTEPAYDEMASKFFEHFIGIAQAMNTVGGTGLWDDRDGFYYDQLTMNGTHQPLRVRSLVGLLPICAVEILDDAVIDRLPKFKQRMRWFLDNRPELAGRVATSARRRSLLAIPSRAQLERILRYLFDEQEFLSPFGIRSLSRVHEAQPFVFTHAGESFGVEYTPGESVTGMFGGNSNWRGPIWMPINFLLLEALEMYHRFYGAELRVELPTRSGNWVTLRQAARELRRRLVSLFTVGANGRRPCHGDDEFYDRANNKGLVLFHEYFDPETGRGLGASHQTGWTALVARLVEDL